MYFDLIRNGSEQNFLRLMPVSARKPLLDDWYRGGGKMKIWLDYQDFDYTNQTGIWLPAYDPKKAFGEQLLTRMNAINARPDPINRCRSGSCYRSSVDRSFKQSEQLFSRLVSRPAAGLGVIDHFPETTLLRVDAPDGSREIYTVLRNRSHSNVAFMMGEERRYQPGLDTLTIYPGVLTSYPNFMFVLPSREVAAFVAALQQVDSDADFERIVERWGIRRTHPDFWSYFHDLEAYLRETEPIEAGALDMNRYENL